MTNPTVDILLKGFKRISDALFYIDIQAKQHQMYFCSDQLSVYFKSEEPAEIFASCIGAVEPRYRTPLHEFLQMSTMNERLKNKRTIAYEFETINAGWLRCTIIPLDFDQTGLLHHILLSVAFVDEEMTWKNDLIRMAESDPLSGLLNHRTASKRIQKKLDQQEQGVLILLDCDRFKAINDNFGHYVGDKYIIAISDLLKQTWGETSIVYRMGGDEFGIFVNGTRTPEVLDECVGRFFANFSHVCDTIPELKDKSLKLTLSAGAVQYLGEARTKYKDLFITADKALYKSKDYDDNHLTYVQKIEQ